jgi:hypothetical protein
MWFYKTHSQSAISIAATQPSVSQATASSQRRYAFLQFSLHPGNHRRVSRQLHHREDMLFCNFLCTLETIGESADSFITEKRHARLRFVLHPGSRGRVSRQLHHRKKTCSSAISTTKPSANQPTASLQRKDKGFFKNCQIHAMI